MLLGCIALVENTTASGSRNVCVTYQAARVATYRVYVKLPTDSGQASTKSHATLRDR